MTLDQQRDLEELRAWLQKITLEGGSWPAADRWIAALDALHDESKSVASKMREEPSARGN